MTIMICVLDRGLLDEKDVVTTATTRSTTTATESRNGGRSCRVRMLMSGSPGTSVDLRNNPRLTSEDVAERREKSNDLCIAVMKLQIPSYEMRISKLHENEKTQLTGISLKPNPLTPVSYNPNALQNTNIRESSPKNSQSSNHHTPPSR